MKKINLISVLTVLLLGCNDSNPSFNTSIQTSTSDAKSLIHNDEFSSICSVEDMSKLNIHSDLYAWGFTPLATEASRHCAKLNLKKLSKMNCQYHQDLMQYEGIMLSEDLSGWDNFIYRDKTTCNNALEIYNAHGEEI